MICSDNDVFKRTPTFAEPFYKSSSRLKSHLFKMQKQRTPEVSQQKTTAEKMPQIQQGKCLLKKIFTKQIDNRQDKRSSSAYDISKPKATLQLLSPVEKKKQVAHQLPNSTQNKTHKLLFFKSPRYNDPQMRSMDQTSKTHRFLLSKAQQNIVDKIFTGK